MADLRSRIECGEKAPWSSLPSLALEKIYGFLSRSDQVNMSLVSPDWSDEFELPTIWRSFRFTMTKFRLLNDNASCLMNCVRKHSRHFRHVRIFFQSDMNSNDFLAWSEHFKTFLQILTNTSQIVSVRFLYLGKCFEYLDIPTRKSICIELDHFFASQHSFKRLEFYGTFFQYSYGMQIMKESLKNCKNSLQTLVLQDFFQCFDGDEPDSTVEPLLPLIFNLPNLSLLEIDYWLIFGKGPANLSDVFEKLRNCRKETHFRILALGEDLIDFGHDFKLLTPTGWRHLKQEYPYLDIALTVHCFPATEFPLESLILEHMPISVLAYNINSRNSDWYLEIEIDAFLSHITARKINNDLVSLTLEWPKPVHDVAIIFIPFLRVCKKLKKLELIHVYPSNNMDVLLESLLNNKPQSLEEFELLISDVVKEQVKPLRNLGSEFKSRLKAVNLNFNLLVEEFKQKDQEDDDEEISDIIQPPHPIL